LYAGDKTCNLTQFQNIYIVGAGKAGFSMALAAAGALDDRLDSGIVIVKDGYLPAEPHSYPITFFEAGHPIPDQRGLLATEKVLTLLENARDQDLIVCLISGGGSALLTAPTEGIALQDIVNLTDHLLACGAPIQSINILRKHLDRIKGGRLSQTAWPASVISLILSDVINDPLDAIASGPTAPDSSTFENALQIIETYHLTKQIPPTIIDHLTRGLAGGQPETPKNGNPLFERTNNVLVGSNRLAIEAAQTQAEAEGYQVHVLPEILQGEASIAGRSIVEHIRQEIHSSRSIRPPTCWLAGGETTVSLTHRGGLGGRNQELALAAAPGLAELPGVILAALATDGTDGPTDAAGAVVTENTVAQAKLLVLDAEDALQNHDSYHFFAPLDDLLKPGPTLTNVNDILFVFQP